MLSINLNDKYIMKQISLEQCLDIQKLYSECLDYHILCSGREATKKDVEELFIYTENKTIENSLTLGIYECDDLIGLVDIFKHYPRLNTWAIGLLLLTPSKRNNKLGNLVHEELKKYAVGLGTDILRIGVLEENILAHKFWKSLGYEKIKEVNMEFGEKKHIVYVYELNII